MFCFLRYYFPHLQELVTSIIAECSTCSQTKPRTEDVPLMPIESKYAGERLVIDYTFLPETKRRNNALLVAIDHFTKR